jgi:hypothetical protein
VLGCPAIVEYSKADQAQARSELDELPEGSIVRNHFMPDYGRLRDQVRACQAMANSSK